MGSKYFKEVKNKISIENKEYIKNYLDNLYSSCSCGSGFDNCDCEEIFYNEYECEICGCDPCECFSDVCCYDPRYQGLPGTCHCADYQKIIQRENHWFYRRWDLMIDKLNNLLNSSKSFLKKTYNLFAGKKENMNYHDDDLPF